LALYRQSDSQPTELTAEKSRLQISLQFPRTQGRTSGDFWIGGKVRRQPRQFSRVDAVVEMVADAVGVVR
jgi:hypothetical protein